MVQSPHLQHFSWTTWEMICASCCPMEWKSSLQDIHLHEYSYNKQLCKLQIGSQSQLTYSVHIFNFSYNHWLSFSQMLFLIENVNEKAKKRDLLWNKSMEISLLIALGVYCGNHHDLFNSIFVLFIYILIFSMSSLRRYTSNQSLC